MRSGLGIADGTLALTQSDDVHATDEVRDCQGLVAVPGLIDAHVHLGLDPSVTDPFAHGRVPEDQQLAAMRKRTSDMLRAGVTTARDLGGGAWLELKVRDEIAAGQHVGTRLLCAGQPLTSPGGHCHFWGQVRQARWKRPLQCWIVSMQKGSTSLRSWRPGAALRQIAVLATPNSINTS